MLKRMLAFSSDRFCWHTGTPVKESYLKERGGSCHYSILESRNYHRIMLSKSHKDKQYVNNM